MNTMFLKVTIADAQSQDWKGKGPEGPPSQAGPSPELRQHPDKWSFRNASIFGMNYGSS